MSSEKNGLRRGGIIIRNANVRASAYTTGPLAEVSDTISRHVAAVISGAGGGYRRWRSVVRRAVSLSANEIADNAIAQSARRAGRSSRNAKGCPMNRAGPVVSAEKANASDPSGPPLARLVCA